MQKNGYTSRDVSKAISGFCIILALIATLSLFSGIGKGGSSTTPGNSDGTSSGTVTGSGSGGTVEPVQDELAGIWVFNNTPEWIGEDITFNVDFSLNGASYSSIVFSAVYEGNTLPMHTGNLMSYGDTPAYFWKVSGIPKYFEGWQFDNYRAISITSKLAEVENGEKLLAYLQANGTKQSASATELITFSIEGVLYQAWSGMTWGEWCNSDFDFNDVYSEELLKIIENGDINHAVSTNGILADILPSMEITANGEYKLTGYPDATPTLITFTIDGTEYQAEQGMTWEQWCESDYNSLDVYVNGNYVVGTTSGYYICSYPDTSHTVNKTTAIVEGGKYYLTNTPHSTGGSAD